jgi:allophanate hydrolase
MVSLPLSKKSLLAQKLNHTIWYSASCMTRQIRQVLALPAAGRDQDQIAIAAVGAHWSGMALNGELKALGGRLLEAARTAPDYKLYALSTAPPKPGMLRVEAGTGSSIELEIWALPAAAFGNFVASIPPPLSIGTIRLADGRSVKGFIVEAADVGSARDISAFSGWRAFVADAAAG